MKKTRLVGTHLPWMAACAAAGGILLSIAPAHADIYQYDGPNGGAFDVAVNWTNVDFPDTLPGETDDATLGRPAIYDGTTVANMVIGSLALTTGSLNSGSFTQTAGSLTTGALAVNAGSVTVSGGELYTGALTSTSGSFTQTGGMVTVGLTGQYNFGSAENPSFTLSNDASFNVDNSGGGFIFRIGSNAVTTTFTMEGKATLNSSITNGYFVFGDSTMFTGTMTDNATINSSDALFYIGDNTAGVAQLTMSGHSKIVSAAGSFLLGSGGSGTIIMNEDSSIEVTANALKLGGGGSDIGSGTVILNDNATITGTKILLLDTGNDTNTAFADFQMNTGSTVNVQEVTIGHLAALGSTATFTVNTGATLTATEHITLGRDDADWGAAEATLNIDGGVVETKYIANGGSAVDSGVAHTVNVNGGTIRALESGTNFFPWGLNGANSTAAVTVNIEEGGLIFDTNSFDVGVMADLSGVGGLTKTGAGVLTLDMASSYLGDTFLEEGELDLSSIYLSDTSKVILADGTVLALNFEGTDEIGFLVVNGIELDPGVYDSTNTDYIIGTGSLTVTGVPEPSTLCLLGAGAMGFLFRLRRIRQRA